MTVFETMIGALERAAVNQPAAIALRDDDGAWTYAQLREATGRVAGWLRDGGVGAGDRVVLRLTNHRQMVALLLGTMQNNSIAVPLGTEMRQYHLRTVLADAAPALVIGEDDDLSVLRDAAPDRLVSGLSEVWTAVTSAAATSIAEPDPDSLALLMYTSGSTSTPKAVMSPHRTVVFATEAIQHALGYRADDVILTPIPLAFDYGLYQLFLALLTGARLRLSDASFPVNAMRAILDDGVTVVPVVPSLAELLITMAARKAPATSRVRMFTNTGAALTPAVIAGLRKHFVNAQVVPMYGTTECKRISILEPDGDLARPGSCGKPLQGTEVLIVAEDGKVLPAGQIGEITVRGPHVMAGYWRAPEVTAQRFRRDADGAYTLHTGDYGRLDEDGYLYFDGRRDDLFKRRGVRMSVVEIEAAAMDVPGVRAAAVFAPTAEHDLTVCAVTSLTSRQLIDALGERLEPAKVPTNVLHLDTMPLTPNGKTDRTTLRGRLADPAAA